MAAMATTGRHVDINTASVKASPVRAKHAVTGYRQRKNLRGLRASAASTDETSTRPPLEERLAAALMEDTALPPNKNPIAPPPLPDLHDLATMAFLEITDEEVKQWTPKVHGVLRWMGALNEVDLDACEEKIKTDTLYRDGWRMPLREDTVTDFTKRDSMYAECKNWEKPFVKVPKVDKKEAAAEKEESKSNDASDASNDASSDSSPSDSSSNASPTSNASESDLTDDVLGMSLLVGKVVSVKIHPDADKLYIEEVDCGEEGGPRTICSGLVQYMSTDDILNKNVIVVANLKPRNMAGVPSAGMLLCANDGGDGDGRKVELLTAPEGAVPGERLTFGTATNIDPHGANKVAKKKLWEKTQVDLITNANNEATWRGVVLQSSAGAVTCATLKGGGIS